MRERAKKGQDPVVGDLRRRPANAEANACIGLGVGVGALGAAAAAISGAVCPLCIVIAPSLVGFGLLRRLTCKNDSTTVEKEKVSTELE